MKFQFLAYINLINFTYTVPQGGILTLLLYIVYAADIQDWLVVGTLFHKLSHLNYYSH